MNIQALLNSINDIRKQNAANLTIGEMLDKLGQFEDNEKVVFSNGKYFNGEFDSYRGYYEDMYIGYDNEDKGLNTVGSLKTTLNLALEQGGMTGYKGGEYPITEDTLIWFSCYGSSGDDMIIDIQKLGDTIYIITKEDKF